MKVQDIIFKDGIHSCMQGMRDQEDQNLAIVTVTWGSMDDEKTILGHTWKRGETKSFKSIRFNPDMVSLSPSEEIDQQMVEDVLLKISYSPYAEGMASYVYDCAQTYSYHGLITTREGITIAWQNFNKTASCFYT